VRYLLDTNVVIDFFTGRCPPLVEHVLALPPDDLAVSVIAVAELRFGADKSARPEDDHQRIDRFLEDVAALPFDLSAAAVYGRVRSELESSGTPIGPNDLLIAAQALSQSLILVTDNEREFGQVRGLQVENWRG
jgi:tRNA(fMet)-specific endonuclease VapC